MQTKRHIDVIKPKDAWVDSAKRCLDAFVKLYKKYNQLGQYVKIATGEMIVGGTTCGATAAAALAKGATYSGDSVYKLYKYTDDKKSEYERLGI